MLFVYKIVFSALNCETKTKTVSGFEPRVQKRTGAWLSCATAADSRGAEQRHLFQRQAGNAPALVCYSYGYQLVATFDRSVLWRRKVFMVLSRRSCKSLYFGGGEKKVRPS